ncbi:ATPase [Microbacterium enclense]|uniref:ATPase n=1 Tax=Microbacterium enclense TaxID=993073 RepID=UPI003F7CFCF1
MRRLIEEEVVIVKSLVWFALGIAGGFVAAHLVNKDPRGQELLAQLDSRIGEFTDHMSDAYHQQETRLSEIIDDAKGVAASAADRASDAVGDASAAAKTAATSSD